MKDNAKHLENHNATMREMLDSMARMIGEMQKCIDKNESLMDEPEMTVDEAVEAIRNNGYYAEWGDVGGGSYRQFIAVSKYDLLYQELEEDEVIPFAKKLLEEGK